ncbi:SpoIID/LytB domain-containing protein [Nocardioides marmoriginsengisoli]|nr:SpoIID/LytB domain-containing protein [Nocardioides marmoriginsengisoli]
MRTRIVLVLTAFAVTFAGLPAADARGRGVPASDPPVNPSASLLVTGEGYGHGRGMSQWGAVNAAIQGKDYKTILKFYYPGTAFASVSARLRVLITGDRDNNTTVKAAKGLSVYDFGSRKAYRLTKATARAWQLRTVQGKTRVYYRTAKWHLYRTGGRVALKGIGEFRSSTGILVLRLPSGDRKYRGALRFAGSDTVNVLSLENYLKGVVPAEMPAGWRPQALQAQAVAARSYALNKRDRFLSRYYQICDTTACQVYKGVGVEDSRTNQAVAATAGQVLTYGGKPAFTEFSASSGGWTSAGDVPYLKAQQDIYSVADNDPYVPWSPEVRINTATLAKKYPQIGTLKKLQITTREGLGDWGGRVQTILLDGTAKDLVISGDDFRSLYGLRSTLFKFGP